MGDVRLLAQISERALARLDGIWEAEESLSRSDIEVMEVELDKHFGNFTKIVERVKKFKKVSEARQ